VCAYGLYDDFLRRLPTAQRIWLWPRGAIIMLTSVVAALSMLAGRLSPAQWSPPDLPTNVAGHCPGVRSPTLRVKYGGGKLTDTGLLSELDEVVWVGPECLEVFVGSPSVHKLPASSGGGWLFSHDFFGSSYRLRGLNNTVQVLHSRDGRSWTYRSNVSGIYWANLFSHADATYLLGTHGDDFRIISPPNKLPMKGGPVTLSRSTDLGLSWSRPSVILQGSFQTGPTPVITVGGNLFRTMEDSSTGCGALVMWAAVGSDLTKASSWARSNSITPPAGHGHLSWQEGSAVEGPDGNVWNILRVNGQSKSFVNKAAVTVLNVATKKLTFKSWVNGPFSTSKFVIRREGAAEEPLKRGARARYFAVSTNITDEALALGAIGARNNLVLSSSSDLINWRICKTLLRDDTGFQPADSAHYTGFEYPDWEFDGEDLLVGVRTAYRGAVSAGSSNRMTALRVRNYAVACGYAAKAEL
jgi:hypothetical protein